MTYDHKIIVRKFNVSSYVLIYFHHNKKPYLLLNGFTKVWWVLDFQLVQLVKRLQHKLNSFKSIYIYIYIYIERERERERDNNYIINTSIDFLVLVG